MQGCRQGGLGGLQPPQFLTDQLTLSQPGGADYAHHSTTSPPQIFRPCDGPELSIIIILNFIMSLFHFCETNVFKTTVKKFHLFGTILSETSKPSWMNVLLDLEINTSNIWVQINYVITLWYF